MALARARAAFISSSALGSWGEAECREGTFEDRSDRNCPFLQPEDDSDLAAVEFETRDGRLVGPGRLYVVLPSGRVLEL